MTANNFTRYSPEEWQRIKDARGERILHCSFSSRFINYGSLHPNHSGRGHTVVLQVMADRSPEKPNKMLCELYVTLEQLREAVAQLEQDRQWLEEHGS